MIPGAKAPEPLDKSMYKSKKSYICKIFGKVIGTGFFCKIVYQNELIPVLITTYQVIGDEFVQSNNSLKVFINEEYKSININENKIIYSSQRDKYDIIIIRLNDGEIKDYLEIDENIFKNSEIAYKDEPIYLLYYPGEDNEAKVSTSDKGIEKLDEYNIKHFCNTELGSSGSPILSAMTDKIIGIHQAGIMRGNYKIGVFLKYPLSELNGN